jgi:Rieske 2Fe-2S family protein
MDTRDMHATAPAGAGLLRTPEPSLPSTWYFDPAQHALELERIWYRNWVYLCRADALAEPLSFRTFPIGDQKILLLRDEVGALKAFHNTCRHRGSTLCREAQGKLRTRRITCPYHAWTYDLSGALVGAPSIGRGAALDPKEFSLYEVPLEVWRGFVFVNLSETAPQPLLPFFDEDLNRIANWPLESLVVAHTHTKVIKANWKIFWENYNECLHCPGVHPNLSRMVPIYGRGILTETDDPKWREHEADPDPKYKGGLRAGAKTWSVDGRSTGHEFPSLDEVDRKNGYSFTTSLPSMYVVAHVDYVRSVRLRPLGPEETELHVEWLLPAETLADPKFDLQNVVAFPLEVLMEDGDACELNQLGIRSRRHRKGMLMPEEYHVRRFQDWVRTELDRA